MHKLPPAPTAARRLALTAAALALAGLALPAIVSAKKPAPKRHAAKPAPHPKAGAAGAWTPDPKLLSQLEPEQAFGPYMMRVPTGYTVKDVEVPATGAKATGFLIAGPERADGIAPQMHVVVLVAQPGYVTRSVDKLLKMDPDLDATPGIVKSPTEDGQGNGLQLSRQYFKYPSQAHPGRQIRGFFYATTDSRSDARMEAMDADPGSAASLALLEASVRTLRKPE